MSTLGFFLPSLLLPRDDRATRRECQAAAGLADRACVVCGEQQVLLGLGSTCDTCLSDAKKQRRSAARCATCGKAGVMASARYCRYACMDGDESLPLCDAGLHRRLPGEGACPRCYSSQYHRR